MKHSISQFGAGFVLALAGLMSQGFAQQQVSGSGWQALTTVAPAVASSETLQYVAWRGQSSNSIWFSSYNGTSWTQQSVVSGSGWTAQTSAAPALTFDANSNLLWLAWKGASTDEIWYSTWNGSSWSNQQTVQGSGWAAETNATPALVNYNGTIYLAWKGDGSAEYIWYSFYSGGVWAYQATVSGSGWNAQTSSAPVLITAGVGDPFLFLYWKGMSTDDIWDTVGNVSGSVSWDTQSTASLCSPETNVAPAAIVFTNSGGGGGTDVALFWKTSTSNALLYSYYDFSSGCGTVSGSGWSAETDVPPAVSTYSTSTESTESILAWTRASDNTIWFVDPTTLPGISAYAH